jgi:hypothetical protein
MTSLLSPILEGLLALSLIGVAIMCWRMDRRLNALRSGRDEAISSAAGLLDAMTRAETAVRGLRATSTEVGTNLQTQIDEARALVEKLEALKAAPTLKSSASNGATANMRNVEAEPMRPVTSATLRARPSARPAPNWADLR